jgi:D-arabinose 1-dehydrogenase-like Zn-dependent alcohol dehydrogenase
MMTKDTARPASDRGDSASMEVNLVWPFAGGDVGDLGRDGTFVRESVPQAGPDDVVARVDTVCICSSDVKIIRMGSDHPLFTERDLAVSPVVLGHELSVTVTDVGANWAGRYRSGQRLGVQPAIFRDGERLTVGIDLPGGFSRYIRLDRTLLGANGAPYVFEVPEDISAATIALLEPYSCVEAAYRPNSRTSLLPGGRVLVIGGPGGDDVSLGVEVGVSEAVLVDAPPALERWARDHAESVATARTLLEGQDLFDDVILAGRHPSETLERAFGLLRRDGLLALVAAQQSRETVVIDAARIHYHGLGLVGAPGPLADIAYDAERNRFDLKPGGSALILGAGGAMGRMHVHRAIGMADGPRTIIATSRKGSRLQALREDFGALAARRGCELVVVEDEDLADELRRRFPEGVDDAVVVAPSIAAIERAASFVAYGGMLVLFAGVSFGQPCRLPLYRVSTAGIRITGSTGSTVEDQLSVLKNVMEGTLDPTRNLEAVAGFDAVPAALKAVTEGRVNGKVAIYPGVLGLPLTPIAALKQTSAPGDARWTLDDEKAIASRA